MRATPQMGVFQQPDKAQGSLILLPIFVANN
jgi:hypothetical protein